MRRHSRTHPAPPSLLALIVRLTTYRPGHSLLRFVMRLLFHNRALLVGLFHQPAALAHDPEPIFIGERACRDQRAKLAQAVSGDVGGLVEPAIFQRAQASDAGGEDRELRVVRIV